MTDPATITDRSTLTLVRRLPGPIDRVWRYLTDPAEMSKWFTNGTVADHVGGDVRLGIGTHGRVTAYQPPHLLEYTWNKDGSCDEDPSATPTVIDSIVRWELAEEGDRVRLTLTHSRLPETELVGHSAGWHTYLDRLRAFAESRPLDSVAETFARLKAEYEPIVRAAGIR